jgi:hypothetical protein
MATIPLPIGNGTQPDATVHQARQSRDCINPMSLYLRPWVALRWL